jgi:cell division protein FtsA
LGSSHITNDVAIGLRTSIDVAEQIKKRFGAATTEGIKDSETVSVEEGDEQDTVSRKELANIIGARLSEIFTFVDKELKSINRSGLLPAGVIITGGGAHLPGVVEVAKKRLRLPARIGAVKVFEGLAEQTTDPSFAVALGLIIWAQDQERVTSRRRGSAFKDVRNSVEKMKGWFRTFLP